jgi:GR25 family glycosyltransferase involved in LPS biosynthesis
MSLWLNLVNEPENVNTYFILEDDARLRPEWRRAWETAQVRNLIPRDFDILFLGGVLPPNRSGFESLGVEKINEFIAKTRKNSVFGQNPPNRYFHLCAYAYVISKSGAKKIFEILEDNDGCSLPADHILCNHYERLKIFFFHPLLSYCYQDEDPVYQQSEFDKNLRVDQFDSDIWNNMECFQDSEIESILEVNMRLDIAAALRDAATE